MRRRTACACTAILVLLCVGVLVSGARAEDACPTIVRFDSNGAPPGAVIDYDVGWSGTWHDQRLANMSFTLAIDDCAGTPPTCGECTLPHLVPTKGNLASYDFRCADRTWIACETDDDCPTAGASGPCRGFIGAPMPVAGGGISACTVNEVMGDVVGTVNVDDGTFSATLPVRRRLFTSVSGTQPCPSCVNGFCEGGDRDAEPCTVNATSALFGDTSWDCPPAAAQEITAAATLPVTLATGLQTMTLAASSPACDGAPGKRCLCDVCSLAPTKACRSSADCLAGEGTCGGATIGAPSKPSACVDDTAIPGDGVCAPNTPPDLDSIDEGLCSEAPVDSRCALEPFRGCAVDADCPLPGDVCASGLRQCFTTNGNVGDAIAVAGEANAPVAGAASTVLGALFCSPPTTAAVVNAAAGLPSPVRLTLPGRFTFAACDEEAELDAEGNILLAPDEEMEPPRPEEEVSEILGEISTLYPDADTSLDTWYPENPCDVAIGGEIEPGDDVDESEDLAEIGITVPPGELEGAMEGWEQAAAAKAALQTVQLGTLPPVTGPVPAATPYPRPPGCYAFGGRDMIFVHGLDNEPIVDALLPDAPNHATVVDNPWHSRTQVNVSAKFDNPEYYDPSGYYKQRANAYWYWHIEEFMRSKNLMNRYVIVAWPSNQRLEVGIEAVLTQIADAMLFGDGVVNPADNTPAGKGGFGQPSFVAMSHSTGGPLFDAAMTAAIAHPNLGAEYIPQFAKAHIAFSGAFSGSPIATLAVVGTDFLEPVVNAYSMEACLLAQQSGYVNGITCPFTTNPEYDRVAESVLVDLMPPMMQILWGSYIDTTPARTVTVNAGHPSSNKVLKHLILKGFDDGVLTVNSQVANPTPFLFAPSFYLHPLPIKRQVKDMAIDNGKPRKRARGFFRDQVRDKPVHAELGLVAAAATPFISTTGMLQPWWAFGPMLRYSNHYSYIQAAADHMGVLRKNYEPTPEARVDNWEETRVLTDPTIFAPYDMYVPFGQPVLTSDNQPLLSIADLPPVVEEVRGKMKQRKKKPPKWRWKRYYHLLKGSRVRAASDYVYSSLLTSPLGDCLEDPLIYGANDCAAAKKRCTATKTCARLKCFERAQLLGTLDFACLEKADEKFQKCFARVEKKQNPNKPGSLCPGGSGDAPIVETKVDRFVDDLVAHLNPVSFGINLCASRKMKCVCNKAKAFFTCHAKAEKSGVPVSSLCLAKASFKFDACFARLDSGGSCLTPGDAATVEAMVDAFVDDVICHLHPASGTC